MFFHGCSDHQDQLLCLFELKEIPWIESGFQTEIGKAENMLHKTD